MGRLSGFKYRDVVKRLKKFGFEFARQAAGSHEIWYNPKTNKYTTIPNHPGDIPEGTLKAILKQADIKIEEFIESWNYALCENVNFRDIFIQVWHRIMNGPNGSQALFI